MADLAARRSLKAVLAGWFVFIALETTIQIVFKFAGATLDVEAGLRPLLIHVLTTPVVLLGFGLYFCGFLVWMTLLRELDLGRAFPMTSLAYIATVTAGVVLFHERLNVTRVAGVLVIIAGVVLLASDENSPRVTEEGIDG